MRYLILILTLLFSINTVAESWSCAIIRKDGSPNVITFTKVERSDLLIEGTFWEQRRGDCDRFYGGCFLEIPTFPLAGVEPEFYDDWLVLIRNGSWDANDPNYSSYSLSIRAINTATGLFIFDYSTMDDINLWQRGTCNYIL